MKDVKIIRAFAEMAGLSEREALKQMPLARLANEKLTCQLRPLYRGSQEELLTMVAASLVNLWYSQAQSTAEPTGNFSGNGYTISKDGQAQVASAMALYNRWRTEAAELLQDDGDFFFAPAGGEIDHEE